MRIIITLIQHGNGRFTPLNNARRENIRPINWKRKISLFVVDVMIYIEIFKESIQKLLQLKGEFGKSEDTKMILRKDVSKMAE